MATFHTSILKFNKLDTYGQPTFYGSITTDAETHADLKTTGAKLAALFPDVYAPLYVSPRHGNISIKFNKRDQLALKKNCVYRVVWSAKSRKKAKTDEQYPVLVMNENPTFVRYEGIVETDLNI
jgi:hypothetical protein